MTRQQKGLRGQEKWGWEEGTRKASRGVVEEEEEKTYVNYIQSLHAVVEE